MDDIDQQIEFLKEKLEILREQMPETPLDAERKAMEVGLIEEQLAELYEKKGLETSESVAKPKSDLHELSKEIESITDELMGIEIKMLKAEMNGNDDEKVKLQLSANALRSRRQSLIDEVRQLNTTPKKEENTLESRIEALEKEVEDLKALIYRLITRQ
jgi:polyhydroxyalkanoate synthesis regulator phasin